MSDFKYQYKVGMRVGLLARVSDDHDKGNIALKIEGAEQYVHISEADLLAGADLICQKLREKAAADAEAAAAVKPDVIQAAAKKDVKVEVPKKEEPKSYEPKSYVPVSQPYVAPVEEKKDYQGGA
jgi:hypothetical protein